VEIVINQVFSGGTIEGGDSYKSGMEWWNYRRRR